MLFSKSHEWIDVNVMHTIATVGVTDFAQKELGEIVYVELPQIGKEIDAGAEVAVLESTKAAADVYSPVSGLIIEVNSDLKNAANLINSAPENKGWIFKIKLSNPAELDQLLQPSEYQALIK